MVLSLTSFLVVISPHLNRPCDGPMFQELLHGKLEGVFPMLEEDWNCVKVDASLACLGFLCLFTKNFRYLKWRAS